LKLIAQFLLLRAVIRLVVNTVVEEFFPNVKDRLKTKITKDRLKTKITITPHFTAFVTSHGKTKSYLHRFKIIVPRLSLRGRKPNNRPPYI